MVQQIGKSKAIQSPMASWSPTEPYGALRPLRSPTEGPYGALRGLDNPLRPLRSPTTPTEPYGASTTPYDPYGALRGPTEPSTPSSWTIYQNIEKHMLWQRKAT